MQYLNQRFRPGALLFDLGSQQLGAWIAGGQCGVCYGANSSHTWRLQSYRSAGCLNMIYIIASHNPG
jgi:hypothetical protein